MPKPPRRSTVRPAGSRPPSTGLTSGRAGGQLRRPRQPAQTSFLERNRTRLVWLAGAIVVLAFGGLFYLNATKPAYACGVEWTAPATSSPGPGETPRLGFPQDDMGRDHVAPGTAVRYLYCPPASGKHYDAQGQGPIEPKLYGPNDGALPEGWIHNLEHGGLVLLYKCPGDACTDGGQAALQQFWAGFPASPICHVAPHLVSPVIARFDEMAYPYAALLWDQVLPLDTLDSGKILAFYTQQGDRTNPEPQCPGSSAVPSAAPSASPAPTASPASGSPVPASPGTSEAPGASPAASAG